MGTPYRYQESKKIRQRRTKIKIHGVDSFILLYNADMFETFIIKIQDLKIVFIHSDTQLQGCGQYQMADMFVLFFTTHYQPWSFRPAYICVQCLYVYWRLLFKCSVLLCNRISNGIFIVPPHSTITAHRLSVTTGICNSFSTGEMIKYTYSTVQLLVNGQNQYNISYIYSLSVSKWQFSCRQCYL